MSIYFFTPNGHCLKLATDVGAPQGPDSAAPLTHDASPFRQRLTFSLGQYPGRVEPGEDHDGPQEGADQGPQQTTAQRRAPSGCLHLIWPLAEDVLIGKSRQAEHRTKQEKQIDVDVQGRLLVESHQGRLDGRLARSDAASRKQCNFKWTNRLVYHPLH